MHVRNQKPGPISLEMWSEIHTQLLGINIQFHLRFEGGPQTIRQHFWVIYVRKFIHHRIFRFEDFSPQIQNDQNGKKQIILCEKVSNIALEYSLIKFR